MASVSKAQWTLAEDLFMAGKSLKYIHEETNIGKSSISERSKKYGWKKGKNEPLIVEAVELVERNEQITEHLTEQQTSIHDKEVKDMLRFKGVLDTFSVKAMKKASSLMNSVDNGQEFKSIVDGVDRHTVTMGHNERFSGNASTVINNSNAQQNQYGQMTDDDLLYRMKESHGRTSQII